jgi:hemolysin activation/secretion protein
MEQTWNEAEVLGLRGSWGAMSYDVFIGQPLRKPENFITASTTAGVSLNYSF